VIYIWRMKWLKPIVLKTSLQGACPAESFRRASGWVKLFSLALFACCLLSRCVDAPPPRVQTLGEKVVEKRTVNGQVEYDTLTAHIPAFQFVDQDSIIIDTNTVKGKIYVVDFFFTHCPSICPKMKAEMHKVYEKYKDSTDFLILSHSIDPIRDSVLALKHYADKLNLDSRKWHFLTGSKDSIYAIADHYLEFAKEDKEAAGGFIHDGNFILIDRQRRIRGYYDGTTDDGTQKLIDDIQNLLHEK
jgi:protein SCO1/2